MRMTGCPTKRVTRPHQSIPDIKDETFWPTCESTESTETSAPLLS